MGEQTVTCMPSRGEKSRFGNKKQLFSAKNKQINKKNAGNLYPGELSLPKKELRNMKKAECNILNITRNYV